MEIVRGDHMFCPGALFALPSVGGAGVPHDDVIGLRVTNWIITGTAHMCWWYSRSAHSLCIQIFEVNRTLPGA